MSTEHVATPAADHIAISDVVARAILTRDSGDWAGLAACYHADAMLTTSWFHGTVAQFLEGAADMKVARHAKESQKHLTGNHSVDIIGDRALAECDQILYQRRVVLGEELDFTTWSRRLHFVERRAGAWRILRRRMIYEKDRVDPARPDTFPSDFFARVDFTPYPPALRYHGWRNAVAGFPPPKELCLIGSAREREVREEARGWLGGASAA